MEKLNSSSVLSQAQTALKKYWYAPGVLILLAALFFVGSWYGQRNAAGRQAAGSRRILHYVDPMNPAHTSPEPRLAPCGMKMEPVYADDGGQAAGSALPPGSVKITPEKQQIMGVRVAVVEKSPWTYTLRTVGKVAVDETRLYRLKALSEGWIVMVNNNSTTTSLVRKDETLATFYVRDLPTYMQTFFYAMDAVDRMKQDPNLAPGQKDLLEAQRLSAESVLINLGMNQTQIKDLLRTRQLAQEIIISAPATGFVLARNVSPGQRFGAGEELYRLADLSRVWVLADLFENEGEYVRPGGKVSVTLPNQHDQRRATVCEVLPDFDPATVTLKVRLDMDNPGFKLRPGMFVDVEFPINLPPTVNVPVDAIMDSGLKQTIFVDRGNGYFEPRPVKTGWRLGDRAEIVEGLKPGERIVVSGNFLIDSESRMKLAAAGFFGEVTKDPVCGFNVDESKAKAAGLKIEHQGKSYYFCSDACQKQFTKTPERYAARPEVSPAPKRVESPPKPQVAPEKTLDPVCGHEVDETQAKAAGLTSIYKGKTYYFCSYRCNKQFDWDPEGYLHPEAQGGSGGSQAPVVATTAKDPVCGLPVATGPAKQAGRTSEYQGKVYYFDTDGCKQRFDKDPKHYLSGGSEAAKAPSVPIRPEARVPLNPEMLLRNQPKFLHTSPITPSAVRPGAHRVMPQGPAPATPAGPTPPMAQPGGAPAVPMATPHGGAQVTPPPGTPAAPQTPPMQPPAAPSPPQEPSPVCPPSPEGHRHD